MCREVRASAFRYARWAKFAKVDRKHPDVIDGSRGRGAFIHSGKSIDVDMMGFENKAPSMSSLGMANASRNGGSLDIKSGDLGDHGALTGYRFNGKHDSIESAGNFLAGSCGYCIYVSAQVIRAWRGEVLREARSNLKRTDGVLITGVLVIAVLYFAREVFVPLALAGLLSFLLAPAATRLERWGLGRASSAILIIVLSALSAAVISWAMLGQIYNLALELPQYQQNVTEKLGSLHLNSPGRLAGTVEMLNGLSKQIESGNSVSVPPSAPTRKQSNPRAASKSGGGAEGTVAEPLTVRIEEPEQTIMAVAARSLAPIVHPLVTAFIVAVFLIFMLIGREDLLDRGLRLAGSEHVYVTTAAIEDASRRVSRYLQMQLAVNVSYGVVAGLLLLFIGVPHPLLWAILITLLRFVPYIGILMAAVGPVLVSIAVSANWSMLLWTALMFVVLEIATANFIEPMLYGASTGMSAIAILTAAIFWTLLWGFPGLLLSTPLTVCLVVIGKQFPPLQFLEVLFGEEAVLPAADRFYQRLLASNTAAARSVIDEAGKTSSRESIYDDMFIPALSEIEEARHAEQMSNSRAEELLRAVEDLADDSANRDELAEKIALNGMKRIACVPARDFADEVGCQLALQVLTNIGVVTVTSSDSSTPDLLQFLDDLGPDVICVVGIPPHAIRHLQMRCHQIRKRLPSIEIVACMFSKESELSKIRSRIATEDAQHVVCSIQLLSEYLKSLYPPAVIPIEPQEEAQDKAAAVADLSETVDELRAPDVFDRPEEEIFTRLASDLARSLEVPIALILGKDARPSFWEAECGLPEQEAQSDRAVFERIQSSEELLVLEDVDSEKRFADEPFFKSRGIRFFAGAALRTHDGESIGSLCVLDTRPRQLSEHQKEMLTSVANAVMTAIELHLSTK
jgi:predicted PurR-regulated permease PerM